MFRARQQFGIYTLIKKLGRGGCGEVWLAERHTKFATTNVAVKLPLDEQVDHAGIEKEAQLWVRASGHANVLPIIEANEYDGQVLIVSEYAMDGSLEMLLQKRGGALPTNESVELIVGILKGLEFLHSRKIIHRDIKPGNILLQGDTPRLGDFGISRVLRTTSQATSVVGTPYYMAPEAFQRKRTVQTDIWSVGVVLYQMLKGELPFFGDNITDLFGAIMMTEPEPLPDSVPISLQKIVQKALTKDKSERYQTAREMRDELSQVRLSSLPSTTQPSPVAAQAQERLTSIKVNEASTIEPAIPPVNIDQTDGVIKAPNTHPENSLTLSQATSRSKTNRLYFLIPLVLLLLLGIIGTRYWFSQRKTVATINEASTTPPSSNSNKVAPAFVNPPAEAENPSLIPFRKAKKVGYVDANKNFVIAAKYEEASSFKEGLSAVKLHGKYGFIDKTGTEVIPAKYSDVIDFSGGLAAVALNGRVGFIDKTGAVVIALKYHGASEFRDGLARVVLKNKYGFVDKNGAEVIPLKYEWAGVFDHGLAPVKVKRKYGFIDHSGREVIALKYQDADDFHEGLASVKQDGKYGFIDATDAVVIPFKYEATCWFSEVLVAVKLGGKYGFIDKTGKMLISPKYQHACSFHEGLASVELNNKWGFIDNNGKEVIQLKYDRVSRFEDGLAEVTLHGKKIYVDKSGTEFYEP